MAMQLLSVNIGEKRVQSKGARDEITGIYKQPVAGPTLISVEGLPGDAICDLKYHGGPDQAVYVYGTPDYEWWCAELGKELVPGTFGENLTISELTSAEMCVGDRLQVGSAVLQVTAPRHPCGTLARRMNDPQFVKRFRQAGRPGLYCRVLAAGKVHAGAEVRLARTDPDPLTIADLFAIHYEMTPQAARVSRCLSKPVSSRTRVELEEQQSRIG